jgi:hypothetical protein
LFITLIIITVIVLATLTWWLYTIKPTSFTLKASVLKLLSLECEMKRSDQESQPTKKIDQAR